MILAGSAQGGVTVVVTSDDAVPGLPGAGGERYTGLSTPVLNNAGQVAFSNYVGGYSGGIYRADAAGLSGVTPIVVAGQASPDGNGVFSGTSTFFQTPTLNDAGQVAFRGTLEGATDAQNGYTSALYVGDGATLDQRFRGQYVWQNPVYPAFTGPFSFNHAGQLAFEGRMAPLDDVPFSDRVVYRSEADGSLTIMARGGLMSGPTLPSSTPGGDPTFTYLRSPGVNGSIALNDQGHLAWMSDYMDRNSPSYVNPLGGTVVWQASPGLVEFRIRSGQGIPGGGTFDVSGVGGISETGVVGAAGRVFDAPGADPNEPWQWASLLLDPVANRTVGRSGGPLLGVPGATSIGVNAPMLNAAGDAVYYAVGTDSSDGLYFVDDAGIRKVAVSGDPWPGGGEFLSVYNPAGINASGQVLIQGIGGDQPASPSSFGYGLFLYDPDDSSLTTVAKTGDLLWGSRIREVYAASPLASDNDTATSLNDAGEVAYRFLLDDGRTGIAIWGDSVAAALDGDYNGNGQIEQGDLDLVLLNWGQNTGVINGLNYGYPVGWRNRTALVGQVDQAELDNVLLNWGATAEPGFGGFVPEPGMGWIMGLAGGLSARRARPRGCR